VEQHLDPDRLVLLALAEDGQDPAESVHLADCPSCRRDLTALRQVAELGAETQELRDLPAPPERMWRAVQAQVGGGSADPSEPAPVAPRPRRRWPVPVLAAVAAAVVAVAGTVVVTRVVQREPAEQVTARATLSALPTVPASAHGSVRILADGRMRVDVRDLPLTTGYHEVWLIDPTDTSKMVSIGNLPDASETELPLPPGTDLNRYRLVDVSDEAHDGDAAHSGHSLLRGTLTS
jgi:hypothetical protein